MIHKKCCLLPLYCLYLEMKSNPEHLPHEKIVCVCVFHLYFSPIPKSKNMEKNIETSKAVSYLTV